MLKPAVPVLGFAAGSGTGKTTLLAKLLPLLKNRGVRVGMIKHAHHAFDIDQPGKDSYELRKAGAEQMLIASRQRWALMVENPLPEEPELAALLAHLEQDKLDLVLVEGFKYAAFPKIELHRAALGSAFLHPADDTVIAVATDTVTILPFAVRSLTRLDINDELSIFNFIIEFMAAQK